MAAIATSVSALEGTWVLKSIRLCMPRLVRLKRVAETDAAIISIPASAPSECRQACKRRIGQPP